METKVFSYNAKDFAALARVTDMFFRRKLTIAFFVFELFSAILFMFASLNTISIVGNYPQFVVMPAILSVLLFCHAFFRYRGRGAAAHRVYEKNNADTNVKYIFLDNVLHSKNAALNTETPYDQIIGFAEIKDSYFLFLNKTSAYLLPKRALEDSDALREFLQTKLTCQYKKYNF